MSHNLNSTRKRPREDEGDHDLHQQCAPQKRHENVSAHDHARQHNGDQYHGNVNIYHGADMAASASRSPEPTAVDSALESLMFEEMDVRYLTVNALLAPSSCRWLLDREQYKRWQDVGSLSEHHGFLWIKGKAGAGKSTLMKFAFDNAEKTRRGNQTIVSFFFNARGAPIERSLIGMYRALLYQILHKIPRLQPLLCKKRTLSAQSQNWSLNVLRSVFQDVIENLVSEHLICYVDALDECTKDDVKEMVSLFEDLGESSVTRGAKFHVCFASRHYPHITIEPSESIVLEDQDGHTADILSYIKKKLKISNKALKREMSKEIEKQASGVFLWVVLVVGILNDECSRGNVQMIRSRLKEIPTGLTELIKDILDRDKPTKYLVPLLQWILSARRPLTPEELFLALQSIESETIRASHTPEALARDNVDKFILNTSKGLAEMTKGKKPKVQFIHELVRTHFLGPEGLVKLDPHLQMHLFGQSHDQLRACCYKYLMSDPCNHVDLPTALPKAESPEGKRLRSMTLDTLPFLQYALENVFYHTNLAHLEGIEQTQFLESFPFDAWRKLHNAIARFTSHRHTASVSQAYILAEQGCAALLAIAMESHPPPDEPEERCRSILGAAVDTRDIRSVLAVLSQDGYENSLGKDNSLCMTHAIESGELAIVQALVGAKAKPYTAKVAAYNHFQATKNNALMLAAADPDKFGSDLGRFGLIRLLLGNLSGEDKASKSCNNAFRFARSVVCKHGDLEVFKLLYNEGGSPHISYYMLCEASRSGNWQLVQFLLRLDPTLTVDSQYTSPPGRSMTPLSAASEAGHAHVVRCLLLEGADPNRGTNALAKAAANGHETIIRILFDNGARLEGVNDDGRRYSDTLDAAISGGSVAAVRLIIQHGGTLNGIYNPSGKETLLTLACRRREEGMVRMLLDNDADINLLDGHHMSPLACAIRYRLPGLARLLIERGADIHQICQDGKSMLHMAASDSDEATVRLLIDKGAYVNVRCKSGETALSIARHDFQGTNIARLLVENGAIL